MKCLGARLEEHLRKGDLTGAVVALLEHLKENTSSSYIALTVWDMEHNIPYIHKYLSDDGYSIPPVAPGRGPLGLCMEKGEPIQGDYRDFPGGIPEMEELVGPVLCLPVFVFDERYKGAIGMGRRRGEPPYTDRDLEFLREVSAFSSLIVAVRVLGDLSRGQREVIEVLSSILSITSSSKSGEALMEGVLSLIRDLFRADYVALGEVLLERRVVRPLATFGFAGTLEVPFGVGVMGIVAEEGKAKLFPSYPVERGHKQCPVKHLIGSALSAPVFVDGRLTYVVVLARGIDKKPFTSRDFYFFTIFQKLLNVIFGFAHYLKERELLERIRARTEKFEALGTFASSIAHDLNNIINVIMGYAQIAASETREEHTKRFLENILKQCEHAARVVSQIRLVSRQRPKTKQLIDLKQFLKSAVDSISHMMPKNIKVVFKDDGSDSYPVEGDPSQLYTMLLNLASNAKDAMPEGGVFEIYLSRQEPPAPMKAKEVVLLKVSDTGCGIPPDIIDKIFDPFFTTKELGKGTGLGLSQVYRTVSSMGGIIDVKSTPGKGTCFYIYLPCRK